MRSLSLRPTGVTLRPDQSRVLVRPFIPPATEHIIHVIGRALALSEEEMEHELGVLTEGFASRHTDTRAFMALPPMHDAPYVAFYEEGEILAALQTWEETLGDDVPDGVSLLLAEYQKRLLSRGRFYFPAELPPDALSEEPKESPISPRLAMPLEGVGPAKDKVGTVGQAVYAGAAAFVLVTRCWHRPSGAPFTVFCNYPVVQVESARDRRHGSIKLHLTGSPLLTCLIRLPTPCNQAVSSSDVRARWHAKGPDGWSANVPGGAKVEIIW